MRYFDSLAEDEMKKPKPDLAVVKQHLMDAAFMAEKVLPYRWPRLATIKVNTPPSDLDRLKNATLEQLRDEIIAGFNRLGLLKMVEGQPLGIANREIDGGG